MTDDEPQVVQTEPAPEISDATYPVPAELLEYEHEQGLDQDPEAA
jgi:hypothetical protein